MSDITCEYCGKRFSSVYSLGKHKKTAGYCIEIQRTQFHLEPEVNTYTCEYCGTISTTKGNHAAHLGFRKVKKEREHVLEFNKMKEELDNLRKQYELQTIQLVQREKDVETLRLLAYEKEKHLILCIAEKNEEIRQLKEQIHSKDVYIQQTPHTTIYQTNNTNNKYEFNFQTVFDKLSPFTDENVKERVGSILPRNLIESNNYNVILNFCSNFGRKLADMVVLTDKSRGLIFIKNKDGEKEKHQVKGFVNKCLVLSYPECLQLFTLTRNLLESYSIRDSIMPEDEARCYGDLTILREYLNTQTLDKTIRMISSIVTENCVYVSKLLPGSVEQKMIEEVTE